MTTTSTAADIDLDAALNDVLDHEYDQTTPQPVAEQQGNVVPGLIGGENIGGSIAVEIIHGYGGWSGTAAREVHRRSEGAAAIPLENRDRVHSSARDDEIDRAVAVDVRGDEKGRRVHRH